MSHNILITGGSGYLGGTLLARLAGANLPSFGKLYALVRTEKQFEAIKQYGAEPLIFDLHDEKAVRDSIVQHQITVVYHLIDPMFSVTQENLIKALSEVKNSTGKDVHFLHTTGAKIFSSHSGSPTDRPLLDTDPQLYDIQNASIEKSRSDVMKQAIRTNKTVIDLSEALGVRSYIFAPYGKGEGFGNPISIQTVAVVRAAKGVRRVYRPEQGRPIWPVCHVIDNTNLYLEILRAILSGANPGHGKNGYYLASPGSIAWDDFYAAVAAAMFKRGLVDDASVETADVPILEKMGAALGVPKEFVSVSLGGKCTFTAEHGLKLGWKPLYKPEHIVEAADEEVELILKNMPETDETARKLASYSEKKA